jgi:hypothetical protein
VNWALDRIIFNGTANSGKALDRQAAEVLESLSKAGDVLRAELVVSVGLLTSCVGD